jgi:acyl carrier protein
MNLYLPYSYKNIEVYHPLPAHFWCHLTINEDWESEDEELKFEVKLIDLENHLLLSIGQVSFQRLKQNLGVYKNSMSKDAAQKPAQESSYFAGKNDILPEEGVEVFKRLLTFKQFPQLVINTTDLNQDILEERPSYKKKEKQEKEDEKSEKASAYERPALSTPFEAPSSEIEIAVATIWKGILGIEKIGVNDTFMELGGNSLLAIQTISNIADEFDLELQPNVFFENPTVKGLSDRIVEMIIALKGSDEIEAMLKEIENEQ